MISAIDFKAAAALAENGYVLDTESSVWWPQSRPIHADYIGAHESDERLLKTVGRSIDVRSGSSALAAEIWDPASEYHLSSVRANLLRPLSHLLTGDTLEIGAGCGTLSRYIGELNGKLLAVEGNLRHAKIAAARCKSLENSTVVCDKLDLLQLNHQFDALVLVDMLEYCRLFSGETDPVAFLRQCLRFLKPSGCLILACENRLGMKYLCGAPEDHAAQPFLGVEDRYTDKTAVAWGRAELLSSLRAAGCHHVQELFPFPDYKLPQLLLTRQALSYGSVVRDLLSQYGPAPEIGTPFYRSFSESAAWKVAADHKLVPELANSFLLVASQSSLKDLEGAFVYSSNRHRAFQCETRITKTGKDFHVEKSALYSDARPSTAKFKWSPSASPFRHGSVYSGPLEAILLRPGWQYDEVIQWARPYFELLVSRVVRTGADPQQAYLPGDQLDCGPHNLSLRADGRLEDFDVEWISLHDLPLSYVFFRSMLHCLNRLTAVAPNAATDSVLDGVTTVMSAFSLKADDEAFRDFLQRESELQSFVAGRPLSYTLDSLRFQKLRRRTPSVDYVAELKVELAQTESTLASEKALTNQLETEQQRLQTELQHLTAELTEAQRNRVVEQQLHTEQIHAEQAVRAGLEQSLSWRVTKPFRAGSAVIRRKTT